MPDNWRVGSSMARVASANALHPHTSRRCNHVWAGGGRGVGEEHRRKAFGTERSAGGRLVDAAIVLAHLQAAIQHGGLAVARRTRAWVLGRQELQFLDVRQLGVATCNSITVASQ